ncbi:MAG: hypothetical protein J5970_03800 [Bacilli bacterium]|nr:hypothetical protein [Bacilli bacterium]
MILKHKSIDYSSRIVNAIYDKANKDFRGLDGIIEVFNNSRDQGYILKIYDSYDPEYDTCVWIYDQPYDEKLVVIYGNRLDCSVDNSWNKEMFDTRQEYILSEKGGVIAGIDLVVNDVFNTLKEKYDKDEKMDVHLNI